VFSTKTNTYLHAQSTFKDYWVIILSTPFSGFGQTSCSVELYHQLTRGEVRSSLPNCILLLSIHHLNSPILRVSPRRVSPGLLRTRESSQSLTYIYRIYMFQNASRSDNHFSSCQSACVRCGPPSLVQDSRVYDE